MGGLVTPYALQVWLEFIGRSPTKPGGHLGIDDEVVQEDGRTIRYPVEVNPSEKWRRGTDLHTFEDDTDAKPEAHGTKLSVACRAPPSTAVQGSWNEVETRHACKFGIRH